MFSKNLAAVKVANQFEVVSITESAVMQTRFVIIFDDGERSSLTTGYMLYRSITARKYEKRSKIVQNDTRQ